MLLDFFNTVANLKNIPRQGWFDKLGIEKPESVSDHTFSMTVMAMIFSDLQRLDTLKILKMSLLHDLAESVTGDMTPSQISKEDKAVLETQHMTEILKNLPSELEREFLELWHEFQQNLTPESRMVHELDKLEMALQAKIYEKNGFGEIQSFLDSAQNQIQNSELKEWLRKIINQ
ncbi:MAG: HD domain-containing protein [Nitrosarchaeum sp.]|nr:HD domain-containing protein [Nitrosarchaeum sp.]